MKYNYLIITSFFLLFTSTYSQMVGGINVTDKSPLLSTNSASLLCTVEFQFNPVQNDPIGLTFDGTHLYTIQRGVPLIYKYTLTGQLAGTLPYPVSTTQTLISCGLDFVGTDLWLMEEQQGVLYKLNPNDGAILSAFTINTENLIDPNYLGIVYEEGHFWIFSYFGPVQLRRVNATTGQIVSSVPVEWNIAATEIINGDLYGVNANTTPKRLVKFDRTTGAFLSFENWCLNLTLGMTLINNKLWATDGPVGANSGRIVRFNSTTLSADEYTDVEVNNIKVFPNPANNYITVVSDENIDNIKVFDILGKQILTTKSIDSGEIYIDISDFSSGMYILKVTTQKGTFDKKYIKL